MPKRLWTCRIKDLLVRKSKKAKAKETRPVFGRRKVLPSGHWQDCLQSSENQETKDASPSKRTESTSARTRTVRGASQKEVAEDDCNPLREEELGVFDPEMSFSRPRNWSILFSAAACFFFDLQHFLQFRNKLEKEYNLFFNLYALFYKHQAMSMKLHSLCSTHTCWFCMLCLHGSCMRGVDTQLRREKQAWNCSLPKQLKPPRSTTEIKISKATCTRRRTSSPFLSASRLVAKG